MGRIVVLLIAAGQIAQRAPQGDTELKSEKEAMETSAWIAAELKMQGFDVSGAELERLVRVSSGISSDLAKLDALKGFECHLTPVFRVEEADDDAG
jgi:hypothetical protein